MGVAFVHKRHNTQKIPPFSTRFYLLKVRRVIDFLFVCLSYVFFLFVFLLWNLAWYLVISRKLGLSEKALQSVSYQGPLGHVTVLHGVFNNRYLSSIYDGQPNVTAIACNVLKSLG